MWMTESWVCKSSRCKGVVICGGLSHVWIKKGNFGIIVIVQLQLNPYHTQVLHMPQFTCTFTLFVLQCTQTSLYHRELHSCEGLFLYCHSALTMVLHCIHTCIVPLCTFVVVCRSAPSCCIVHMHHLLHYNGAFMLVMMSHTTDMCHSTCAGVFVLNKCKKHGLIPN